MDVYDFNAISCLEGYFSDMNLDIISNVSVGIGVVNIISLFFYSYFYLGRRPGNYSEGTQDRLDNHIKYI
jgi:hypothetical protein